MPYGRKFSTYEMDVQVPYSILPEIQEKNNIQQVKGRYTTRHKKPVQVERSRDSGGAHDAGSCTSATVNTAEDEYIVLHGVSQR